MEILNTDVLVIGGGSAGLRATIEVKKAGAKTILVTKGILGNTGTSVMNVTESAGFSASGFVDIEDNFNNHFQDIMVAGLGMNDPILSKIVAVESPKQLLFLANLGVPFLKKGCNYLAACSCFSSRPRSIRIKGHGKPIVLALKNQILKENIKVIENSMAIEPILDTQKKNCIGALILDGNNKFVAIRAKATILATGGAGQLFDMSFIPVDVTGDGHVFGLKAGAELINMEFMQAGFGIMASKKNIAFQYWLWNLRPKIMSIKGEEFIERFIPKNQSIDEIFAAKSRHYPFSTRDSSKFMEIAVQSFINEKRDNKIDDTVWATKLNDPENLIINLPNEHNFKKMWQLTKEYFNSAGLDIKSKFRIACFAHTMNGGLLVDQFGKTSIEGLYAVGEVAGGPHGADRLGGNMFPTCQIFAERAALHASLYARENQNNSNNTKEIFELEKTIDSFKIGSRKINDLDIAKLRSELQRIASRALLVIREEKQIKRFLSEVKNLENMTENIEIEPKFVKHLFELRNLILIGKVVANAALMRTESRGSHYRKDFPKMSKRWNKKIVISLGDKKEIICKSL